MSLVQKPVMAREESTVTAMERGAINLAPELRKEHSPQETSTRSGWKTISYRIGSVLTVGPASAWLIAGMTTGHWDAASAIKTFAIPTMVGGAVFNSAHYYLMERGYARVHSGYKFLREKIIGEEEKHAPEESQKRTIGKTLTYRGTALATATPLAAMFTAWWVTGHWDPANAMKVYYGAAATASIIFNSLYYYGAERVYTRIHSGYKALRRGGEKNPAELHFSAEVPITA